MVECHTDDQSTTHLEGFVQDIGHLVLEILRRSEGAREQKVARTASIHTNPGWEVSET